MLFPDIPFSELESICKDTIDFDHALEVVLHRTDNKDTPNKNEAGSMINDEDMNGNQNDLESLTSAGVYGECYTVVIGMFL